MSFPQLSSYINPLRLMVVTVLLLTFGYFPRGTSFFYFLPSLVILSFIALNKYTISNKFLIIVFLISAIMPIPLMSLNIDIARDITFLLYFFSAIILGQSLARYMPLEYLIYGLFLAGAFITIEVIVDLIIGFQGDFSLLAIRHITPGAGDFGLVFMLIAFYGRKNLGLMFVFLISFFLMLLTQSRTMLLSFLIWNYFLIIIKSKKFFKWFLRFSAIVLVFLMVVLGASADAESYSFIGKILRSFQEIIPNENQNLHSNWRAVESGIALNSFISGSYFEIFFGKGLGYSLPLGFEMTLLDEMDSIPILHNGYLYILLKYGIFGLFIWYKILSSLVIINGNPALVSISKTCFFIILFTQLVSGGVLQYQGLVFLIILAACSTLNSKNATFNS